MSRPRFAPVFALLALATLAAGCSTLTPQAQCFADATVDYRAAWRGAEKIRADLARGYALHIEEIETPTVVPCRIDGARSTCLAKDRMRITLPVAIDHAALTERLAELEAEIGALRPTAMAAAAPCGFGDWADAPAPR